jgi:hypothetical protein
MGQLSTARPKSSEVIQAQLASFGAEHLPDDADSSYLFRKLGGAIVRLDTDMIRTVATVDDYVDHLRQSGGARSEFIKRRADLTTAFREFEPYISEAVTAMRDPRASTNHPDYLGSGGNANAFLLSRDAQDYVVRVPKRDEANPQAVDFHLRGSMRAMGIPHLEQVVAASYEHGVTISERMVGKEVSVLPAETLERITSEQLDELIDTVIAANQAGITIDPKPSNIFYDSQQGFGIIDLGSSQDVGVAKQTAPGVLSWLPTTIHHAGLFMFRPVDRAGYAYSVTQLKAQLGVLELYKTRCLERFDSDTAAQIVPFIDSEMRAMKMDVDHYDDSIWVTQALEGQRLQQQAREHAAQERAAAGDPTGWARI